MENNPSDGIYSWLVTFSTNVGDVPKMQIETQKLQCIGTVEDGDNDDRA